MISAEAETATCEKRALVPENGGTSLKNRRVIAGKRRARGEKGGF